MIGEDIVLNCDGTSCSTKKDLKWIGGPDYKLLSIGDVSTSPSKYEIISTTMLNYVLQIKNLSFDDFNCTYTCACGLQQYSKKLNLDAVNYICKFYNYVNAMKYLLTFSMKYIVPLIVF